MALRAEHSEPFRPETAAEGETPTCAPAMRPFLRKGAYKQRYEPRAVRERIGARLAAKASGAAASARTPQPRGGSEMPHRHTPLSDATTAERDALPRAHRELHPPQPPLSERFGLGVNFAAAKHGTDSGAAVGVVWRGRASDATSVAEFEALEQMVRTEQLAAANAAVRAHERDTRSPSPPTTVRTRAIGVASPVGTPERSAPATSRAILIDTPPPAATATSTAASAAIEGGSAWWDSLYADLNLHLPRSPQHAGAPASAAGPLRPPARSATAPPPPAPPADQPPPTSKLVASLFHAAVRAPAAEAGGGHGAPAAARRPATACVRGASALPRATVVNVSPASAGTPLSQPTAQQIAQPTDHPTDPADADAHADAHAVRTAIAHERLRLVRARERHKAASRQLAERERELNAKRAALEGERAEFDKWREDEGQRMGKEQRHLERQARVLLKLPDRDERKEVAELRAQLHEAHEQGAQRERRARLAHDRLRAQLHAAAAQNDELHKEVQLLSSAAISAPVHVPIDAGKARTRDAFCEPSCDEPPRPRDAPARVGEREAARGGAVKSCAPAFDVRALIKQSWPVDTTCAERPVLAVAGCVGEAGARAHDDDDEHEGRPARRMAGGLFHSPPPPPGTMAAAPPSAECTAGSYNHLAYEYAERSPRQPMHCVQPPLQAVPASVYADARPALAPVCGNGNGRAQHVAAAAGYALYAQPAHAW